MNAFLIIILSNSFKAVIWGYEGCLISFSTQFVVSNNILKKYMRYLIIRYLIIIVRIDRISVVESLSTFFKISNFDKVFFFHQPVRS